MAGDTFKLDEREAIYEKLEQGEISMGQAVRELRKCQKLTQPRFAAAIGIDVRVLSGFERGTGNLRRETISKILSPFGLELTARRSRF
jgi:transcriptional regulator with XRE-family HTH domain